LRKRRKTNRGKSGKKRRGLRRPRGKVSREQVLSQEYYSSKTGLGGELASYSFVDP